jgi:hypothetical protein
MGDALLSLMCTIALDFGAVIAVLTAELGNAEERKPKPEAVTAELGNASASQSPRRWRCRSSICRQIRELFPRSTRSGGDCPSDRDPSSQRRCANTVPSST